MVNFPPVDRISAALGVLAFLFMLGGFFGGVIPFVGASLSLLAPIIALCGFILGGLSLSRKRVHPMPPSAAVAGLILNGLAFFPSVLLAMTCGMCNACVSAGLLAPQSKGVQWFYQTSTHLPNAVAPPPDPPLIIEDGGTHDELAPPPAFPPPPLNESKSGTGAQP